MPGALLRRAQGGEALVRKRFTGGTIERAHGDVAAHGLLAVLVPSLLPPPAPFKIFVLLAGVAGMRRCRFAAAIAIGRGDPVSSALGVLAVRYGEQGVDFIAQNGTDGLARRWRSLALGRRLG